MERKKIMLALFAMLVFVSKNSFSHKIVRYVKNGKVNRVRKVLQKKNALVNEFFIIREGKRKRPVTLLRIAVKNRLVDMVKLLLEFGADPNLYEKGVNLLSSVVGYSLNRQDEDSYRRYREIMNLLLEYGANANVKDDFGGPLYLLMSRPDWKRIRMLLGHGANPLVQKTTCSEEKAVCYAFKILKYFQIQYEYLKLHIGMHKQGKEISGEGRINAQDIEERFIIQKEFDFANPNLFVKLKALTFLLKQREAWSIRDEKIKEYFRYILFTHAFFSNDFLLGFALENRYLGLVDSRGRTIQEAMETCVIPEIISTAFGRIGKLYESRNLAELLEDPKRPQDVEEALVKMVKRAKLTGRKDIVKKFYTNYACCRILSSIVPPEVAGHITSFL